MVLVMHNCPWWPFNTWENGVMTRITRLALAELGGAGEGDQEPLEHTTSGPVPARKSGAHSTGDLGTVIGSTIYQGKPTGRTKDPQSEEGLYFPPLNPKGCHLGSSGHSPWPQSWASFSLPSFFPQSRAKSFLCPLETKWSHYFTYFI